MTQSSKEIKSGTVTDVIATTITALTTPKITSIAYVGNDTAADTAGGQTITITGTGFATGASVLVGTATASVVTVVSSTSITFTSPANSAGSYILYVVNSDGGTGIAVPGIQYSGTPAWTTSAGSLGSQYETSAFSRSVSATGDAPVTYSVVSGSLPTGATLNTNGTITGTSVVGSGSPTTYTFTVAASDAQNQDTNRQFSITINPDVITWSSPSNGSVVNSYEYSNISNVTLSATSAASDTVNYSASGLPTGLTLSAGVISGAATAVGNTATTITATGNATTRTASETIYFNVQQDVVTWGAPTPGSTVQLDGTLYSQVLSATSAAGKSITYTANALPTGLSLSSGTVSGTPTVEGTSSTLFTATAASTNRSATNTITWVISLADLYWQYTTLLISASASSQTSSIVNDASINNAPITVPGDTRVQTFNQYQPGYYSVQFNGTSNDYVSIPHNSNLSIMSGDTNTFIAECWVYWTTVSANQVIMDKSGRNGVSFQNWSVQLDASKYVKLVWGASGSPGTSAIGTITSTTIPVPGMWYHIALVKSSAIWSLFINGTRGATYSGLNTATDANPGALRIGLGIDGEYNGVYLSGYVSNVSVFNGPAGSAPYSASSTTITIPTSPKVSSSYVSLVTCNRPRHIDSSPVYATVTAGSGTKIVPLSPFGSAYQLTAQYYSTNFNGSTDYLYLPSNSAFALGTSNFTIELWFNTRAKTNDYPILLCNGDWNMHRWQLDDRHQDYPTKLVFGVYDAQNTANWLVSSTSIQNNTWYHVAIVRSGNTFTMYLNGVAESTQTYAGSVDGGAAQTIYVGQDTGQIGTKYNGLVNNLRITKTVVYSTAFTPSTTPLTAIANTVLLLCNDTTIKDNSSTGATITIGTSSATQVPVSPFALSYSSTLVNTYGSMYFDGSGDYCSIASSPAFALSGDYTIEAWVYRTDSGTQRAIVDLRGGSYVNVLFYMNSSNQLTAFNSTSSWITSTNAIPLNQWVHVAIARSGSTVKQFINGVVDGTATNTDTNVSSGPVYIGRQNGTTSNDWLGYISNVRIIKGTALYTSVFTPSLSPLTNVANTQLLTLQYNGPHNNNTINEVSGFNNIVAKNGNMVSGGTFSPYGDNWSNYFDGSSYITFPSSAQYAFGTGAFTFEGWVNLPTGTNNKQITVQGSQFLLGTGGYSGSTVGTLRYYSGPSSTTYTCSYLIANDQWNHLAVVRESTSANGFKMYVNGMLAYVGTDTGNYGTSGVVNYGSGGTSDYLTGYVSNFRILKGTAQYTTASTTVGTQIFTPPTSPLTATANTSLLTGQSRSFADNSVNNFTPTINGSPKVQKFSPFSTLTVSKYYSTYFDGSGDYLTLPSNQSTFSMGTGDFTIEMWVYVNNLSVQRGLYDTLNAGDSTGTGRFGLQITTAGVVQVYSLAGTILTSGGTLAVNTWYHIAYVRISNSGKLYVNGSQVNSTYTDNNNYVVGTSTRPIVGINGYDSSSFPMSGYISNLRVVKGLGVYTGSFTPPTSPLSATQSSGTNIAAISSGTSLLTCKDSTVKDNSINSYALTTSGDVRPLAVSPFTPTANASSSYDTTTFGGSMYFDGSGDYLVAAHQPSQWMTTSDFTVEGWIYTTKTGSEQVFVGKQWQGSANAYASYVIYLESGNTVRVLGSTSGGSWEIDLGSSTATVKQHTWTHLALTRSGSTFRLFINGILDKSGTNAGSLYTTSDPLTVGAAGPQTGYNAQFQGYMSDVRVIRGTALYTSNFYPGSTPLTSSVTVNSLPYSATFMLPGTGAGIIDSSRTSTFETAGETKPVTFSPYNGNYYSNYFNGTSDYMSTAHNTLLDFGTGNFTIEFWIYPITWSSGTAGVVGKKVNDSSDGWQIYRNSTQASKMSARLTQQNDFYTTSAVEAGVWSHWALVRTGTTLYWFKNGVLDATGTSSANITDTSASLYVGYAQTWAGYGNFYLSNLRIIKGAAQYTSGFTPSTVPLTAIANTSLLTCQSNKFVDNSTNAFSMVLSGPATVKVATQNPFQVNAGISYYFDGSGDYISVPYNPAHQMVAEDMTIECWVYRNAVSVEHNIAVTRSSASSDGWNLRINSANTVSFYFTGGTTLTSTGTIAANVWTHIAFSKSGNTGKLFINGTVDGTTASMGTGTANTQPLRIGVDNTTAASYMNGYIADFRITKGYARYTSTFTPPSVTLKLK
jgi:hypothetical protein